MHLTSASPREKGTRAEVETLLILNNATESSSLSLEEGGWGREGGRWELLVSEEGKHPHRIHIVTSHVP